MNPNYNRPQKPEFKKITAEQIEDEIKNKISTISNEFQNGFNLIKKHPKSVTFFGSARTLEMEADYILARNLAKRIVTELPEYSIITGGSTGIMEAANRGAFEGGGQSIGLNIKLPHEQKINQYLTDTIEFEYFFTRKVCLSFSAEAYIYFPGGFGTLDELFEILTLVQTKKIDKVPIILFGSDYWNNLNNFIKETLLKSEKIDELDIDLYKITNNEDEVLDIIKNTPVNHF